MGSADRRGHSGVPGRPAGIVSALTHFIDCTVGRGEGRFKVSSKEAAEQGPVLLAAGALFVSTFHTFHAAKAAQLQLRLWGQRDLPAGNPRLGDSPTSPSLSFPVCKGSKDSPSCTSWGESQR